MTSLTQSLPESKYGADFDDLAAAQQCRRKHGKCLERMVRRALRPGGLRGPLFHFVNRELASQGGADSASPGMIDELVERLCELMISPDQPVEAGNTLTAFDTTIVHERLSR